MSSQTVTARINDELAAQLDRLAAGYDRPRGWVIAKALERYLPEELDLLDSLAEAEADIEAGQFYTQEQMEDMFNITRGQRDAA